MFRNGGGRKSLVITILTSNIRIESIYPFCPENGQDIIYDVVTRWKHFPRYRPFMPGIHQSPVNSPHIGQWLGSLMFSLTHAWTYGWVNNGDGGGLRRYCTHYDVNVMWKMRYAAIITQCKFCGLSKASNAQAPILLQKIAVCHHLNPLQNIRMFSNFGRSIFTQRVIFTIIMQCQVDLRLFKVYSIRYGQLTRLEVITLNLHIRQTMWSAFQAFLKRKVCTNAPLSIGIIWAAFTRAKNHT